MSTSGLASFEGIVGGLARHRPVLHVPAQGTLDDELRQQRLNWVRIYSLGIGVFGIGWCLAFLAYALIVREVDEVTISVTAQAAVLGIAGWHGLYRCRLGGLRQATYANFAALLLAATTNLAFTTNAEGVAVVTY